MAESNMKTTKFSEAYERLNTEQKKAVDTIDGPVMVIAGPGTGKTEVLTMRIANIIKKTDTPPDAILALTFTESGVASMRKRLVDLIGAPAYEVTIETFHGFANSIIGNYPDKFPDIIGSSSITDVDQIRILRDIIDATAFIYIKPFGDKYYYLKHILKAINDLKGQGVSPGVFTEAVTAEKREFERIPDLYYEKGPHEGKMRGVYQDRLKHIERNGELVLLYKKYQETLRAAKQYDFSDMIMYVMFALTKDEDFRLSIQESYHYFLVDEHQDTNDAQNKIIELLAGYHENPNVFVVGDEKQAIFRFQGASMANFYHFKKLFKKVELISLRNNYRSTQAILDAAQKLSPRDTMLVAKAGHIEVLAHLAEISSPEAEYYFIAKKVSELLGAKIMPEEIAILYRENRDATPITRMLEKLGIPSNIESEQDVLGDEDIKKLLRILKAIQNFGSEPELFELLHIDFLGCAPIDIYKLAFFRSKKRLNVYDVIKSESLLREAGVENVNTCINIFTKLSQWRNDVDNTGALKAFETIVRDSGFLVAILNRHAAPEKIRKLHVLFEHLKSRVESRRNYTLKDFFEYLDLVKEQDVTIKTTKTFRLPGRIRLMTAHRAKGQEFEHVFIINAIDGKWGSRRRAEHIKLPRAVYRILESIEEDIDESDDERNIFYVALTRAKKEVFISYSSTNRDGREQLPTQFIQEMREGLLDQLDMSDYEKEFALHPEIEFAPDPTPIAEIKDKTFLNTLYSDQGLSVTALDNYIECPWKYFYLNLLRIPEAPNKHLLYGNAVHETVKNFFNHLGRGEKADQTYLINRFEEALVHQPFEENEYSEALAKGRKSLAGWYHFYHKSWISRTLNEFKIAGIELEPGTVINGKLDKMEFLDDGNRVNVVDYKTGKPKSRNVIEGKTKSSDGNYKRQLVFYRLLLDKSAKYKMVSGDIDFIEADDAGKLHKEHFEITPEEVAELEKKILEISREIQNLAFWDRFCDDSKCRYCELRRGLL